jgi:Ca2+-binding EF-hand superfamily protein
MKPWCAFSACDINNDDQLNTSEMARLFELMEKKPPLVSRVQHDMKMIDKDGGGTVSRMEWMQYLVSPDPKSGLESYDLKLRGLFDKFDEDHNARISKSEMSEFLLDYFRD